MKKSTIAILLVLILLGSGLGGWKYYENKKIEEMRNSGLTTLEASIKLSDYREAEQAEIKKVLSETEDQIRSSKDQSEIDKLVEDAAASFANLKTDAQYAEEEMRDAGIEALRASINLDDYREAEQTEIKKLLSETEAKIKESNDKAEIDALLEGAAASFSEYKTDVQYAEEEAAAAAAAAAKSKSSSGGSGASAGCVGGGSDVFN